MADNSSPFRIFWPEIDDLASALSAAKNGAVGSWITALFGAGALALLYFRGSAIAPETFWGAAVVALIFAALGYGVWRGSRVCAIAALSLYIIDRVSAAYATGVSGASVLSIALLLFLISGVRGTVAFQKYSKLPTGAGGGA